MDYFWLALVVLGLAALPGYLYVLNKFAQVGRMAGARWFLKRCKRETGSGTDGD